jgi:ElaA protein
MSTPVSGSGIITRSFDQLSTRELHAILELRNRVFVVEQDCVYNDIDGRDIEPTTRHLWISLDGRVAAYARQLRDDDGTIRIGRVVTNVADRGSGLARDLVSSVVESSDAPIVLDAQTHLAGWYETFGFEVDGEEFIEDGIPHITMRKG